MHVLRITRADLLDLSVLFTGKSPGHEAKIRWLLRQLRSGE